MEIRNASADDVLDIIEVGVQMFDESPHFRQFDFDGEKVFNFINYMINDPDGIVIVAVEDGKVIGGFLGGIAEHWFGSSKAMYDNALFLRPDYRHGGIALKLIGHAFEQAKAKGAVEAILTNTTGVESDRIEKLYQYCGMTRVGGLYYMLLED